MGKKTAERAPLGASQPEIKTKYIRLIPLGRGTGHFDAFQPEVIEVVGDEVVSRKILDKPNLYEFAYAIAADHLDPRNEVKYERAPI